VSGGVAAVVAFLVGVTSLIDFVSDKVDSPEPRPPRAIDARIGEVRLTTTNEPYGRYLRDTNQSFGGLAKEDRQEQGLVFAARVQFKGGQDEPFLLRATVFAASGRRVPGYTFDEAEFTPRGPNHGREWTFWVPYPPHRGAFFVRATVLDSKKQPVAEQDSGRFAVERVPAIAG
jgi:hypothetical protein